MPALQSALDIRSAAFRADAARMDERLAEMRGLEEKVRQNSASKRKDSRSAGRSCRASGSTACSTVARRSSNS